jgi:kinesin family protein 5
MKFDMLSRMDNRQLADNIAEREKLRQRSLQQRLEQLVAVHRQLLRKFASLELENAELKKKSQLKDERIKQLENSARSLIGNVRQQTERYMSDLAIFKEQVQVIICCIFDI